MNDEYYMRKALEQGDWQGDPAAADRLRADVEAMAAQYFTRARARSGAPADPVARFHLGNGAAAWRVNWPADLAPGAVKNAHGLMINYLYDPAAIETQHEAFVRDGTVATGAPLAEVLQASFPWCAEWEDELKRLFRAYVEAKQAQQVLDYDDLLLYWAQMVAEPALGAEIGGLFDHVLVDEYQDTNHLQAAILLAMKPDGRGLTVVGDDAQSIYAFRGATVRNILDFPAAFDPPAHVVTLEQNYRSTRPILEAANAVIALAAERFTKNLWSERESAQRPRIVAVKDDADQATFVVDGVLARREEGLKLKQQASLSLNDLMSLEQLDRLMSQEILNQLNLLFL